MGAKTRGPINTAAHSPIPLTARDVEALFLRRAATPAQTARVGHALEEITLQTLAALNAAAIGRDDVIVNVKPEDGADIEAVLIGLRYALALLTPADAFGDEDDEDAEDDCPDYFEDEEAAYPPRQTDGGSSEAADWLDEDEDEEEGE